MVILDRHCRPALKCKPIATADTLALLTMVQLAFFPGSLPDESIYSRISRYHILSGHRDCRTTYSQLFRSTPFAFGEVVPPRLSILVSRIPQAPPRLLGQILRHNTLLPLVMPFLALGDEDDAEYADLIALTRGVLKPMRQRGDGELRLCPECIRVDRDKFGCGYWHRSHQMPAVTACWRHGVVLINACPKCDIELSPRNVFLHSPWRRCVCGHDLMDAVAAEAIEGETNFARYVKVLLDEKVRKFTAQTLEEYYLRFLSEKSPPFSVKKTTQPMLLSILLERHRKSFSSLDAIAYSIGVLLYASGARKRRTRSLPMTNSNLPE